MPTLEPHELQAQAEALARRLEPNSPDIARYALTESLILAGGYAPYARPARWIRTLHAYERHWRRHGRAPRENTRARATLSDEERRLGEWARYQRRFEDRLNAYQRARLDVTPAFDWDPLERLWRARLAACVLFFSENGTLPRLNSTNQEEFFLARWLGRQLHRLQSGLLERRRAEDLHRLLRLRPRP